MGLNPAGVTFFLTRTVSGRIPEWPNGADCKSAGCYLRWFESISAHFSFCGNSSVGRARPCQGRGREFESRLPLHKRSFCKSFFLLRCVSSVWLEYMPVTHGVTGSSPVRTASTEIHFAFPLLSFTPLWCVSSVWLEYMPVTHGVTGSSPVRTASSLQQGSCHHVRQEPFFNGRRKRLRFLSLSVLIRQSICQSSFLFALAHSYLPELIPICQSSFLFAIK